MSGPLCVLYTQDAAWQRRISGFLQFMAAVRHADTPATLRKLLAGPEPLLLLIDIRAGGARDLLRQIRRTAPHATVIALGVPRSDPLREAEALGVYATEDLAAERQRIQSLVGHALDYVALAQENESLRRARGPVAVLQSEGVADARRHTRPAEVFAAAFRRPEDAAALLQGALEGVARAMVVLRCGAFAQWGPGEPYRMRAALRCSAEAQTLEYDEAHPLPVWFETHPQLLSRHALDAGTENADTRALRQALHETGAEVIVPLFGSRRLLGWLFVGPRATGLPFTPADLEDLLLLAEPIASALENALAHQDVAAQQHLLQTLLSTLPTGIVAFDPDGSIRWLNRAAQDILKLPPETASGRAVETLGNKMADAVRRALHGDAPVEPVEWTPPSSKRTIRVQTRRLGDRERCLGAVALLQDVGLERGQGRSDETEPAAFWAELAASLSHEIRNPLVAVKTLAQLLPERYADPAFRSEFSELVSREIDRLDDLVEKIQRFAHPPEPTFKPLDIRRTVQKGLNLALVRQPENGVRFEIAIEDGLPPVYGDETLLSESFAHLFRNAIEAVFAAQDPRVAVHARRVAEKTDREAVLVTITDNGGGIPAPIRDKIFSPFCSTKARGLGLGLPIVKRAIADHNGRIRIDTGDQGTSVSVLLPVAAAGVQPASGKSTQARRTSPAQRGA